MKGISEHDLERLLTDEEFIDRLAARVAEKVATMQAANIGRSIKAANEIFAAVMAERAGEA